MICGLTAEEKVGCWSNQQVRTAGQWTDESKDPAKHQQDQAEGQHDDHDLMQACKHTYATMCYSAWSTSQLHF